MTRNCRLMKNMSSWLTVVDSSSKIYSSHRNQSRRAVESTLKIQSFQPIACAVVLRLFVSCYCVNFRLFSEIIAHLLSSHKCYLDNLSLQSVYMHFYFIVFIHRDKWLSRKCLMGKLVRDQLVSVWFWLVNRNWGMIIEGGSGWELFDSVITLITWFF